MAVLTGPGLLFVVSGRRRGKDTLVEGLKARRERLLYSVSATTREPRPGEREGIDYFFLEVEEFRRRLTESAFLEWREYNGTCTALRGRSSKTSFGTATTSS